MYTVDHFVMKLVQNHTFPSKTKKVAWKLLPYIYGHYTCFIITQFFLFCPKALHMTMNCRTSTVAIQHVTCRPYWQMKMPRFLEILCQMTGRKDLDGRISLDNDLHVTLTGLITLFYNTVMMILSHSIFFWTGPFFPSCFPFSHFSFFSVIIPV